jgi:hypothetical protein
MRWLSRLDYEVGRKHARVSGRLNLLTISQLSMELTMDPITNLRVKLREQV